MNRRRASGGRGVAELTSSLLARAMLTGTLDRGLLEPLWAIRCRRSRFGLGTYRCKYVANASSSDGNVLWKRQEAQLGSPHKSLQRSFHAGWDWWRGTASTSSFAVSRAIGLAAARAVSRLAAQQARGITKRPGGSGT